MKKCRSIFLFGYFFFGCALASAAFGEIVKNGNKPATPPNVAIPVTVTDVQILRRASQILADPSAWNRKDNRKCPEGASSFSLYCALFKASVEINGEFDHRLGALE